MNTKAYSYFIDKYLMKSPFCLACEKRKNVRKKLLSYLNALKYLPSNNKYKKNVHHR